MARSWEDVKADKAARDQVAGRDVDAAREAARTRTHAYVRGFRRAWFRRLMSAPVRWRAASRGGGRSPGRR
jgi:hypothetical protein